MSKLTPKGLAKILFIITAALASAPLAGHAASEIVVWGANDYGQLIVPSGLSNVVAIAAGYAHNLALTSQGRVVSWGQYDQTSVPSGLSSVVAIAAEYDHSLALTTAGRVRAWGYNEDGQTTVPSGLTNAVAIAAGMLHSLALMADGRVVAWGDNDFGQTSVPSGLSNVVAISAGHAHNLALTSQGRVVAWGAGKGTAGAYQYGQAIVPSGLVNVVAIAAGGVHSLALTADDRVVAWGDNAYRQTTVPSGLTNIVAIAAGNLHSLALTAEGRVVGWGSYSKGYEYVPMTVPSGLSNVVAIAGGWFHSLALIGTPPGVGSPRLVQTLDSGMMMEDAAVNLRVQVQGKLPMNFQWFFNGQPIIGATDSVYDIPSVSRSDAGIYSVIASNALGSVTNEPATIGVHNVIAANFTGLVLTAPLDTPLQLQSAPAVIGPWSALADLTLATSPYAYTDFTATNDLQRFYRTTRSGGATPPDRLEAWCFSGWTLSKPAGSQYRIEYVDAQVGFTNWQFLTNLTLPASPYLFIDTTATNHWTRYYRTTPLP